MENRAVRKQHCAQIGANLRSIRKDRGMTQEQLAGMLGSSKQVLSRYERGERCLTLSTAAQYAHCLRIPLSALTDGLFKV